MAVDLRRLGRRVLLGARSGWPWRGDGPWSVAADVGPALVYGLLLTWGADIVLRVQPNVTAVRPSLVFVASTLTMFPLGASGALVAVNVVPLAIDRLHVRMQVGADRELRQTVRLESPVTVCA
ncbi:hypothetical protein OJ998_22725 [Solirubrobacter taibaiensis]|nr:hypothetical protein [Solirubrobacter taibaiensis]